MSKGNLFKIIGTVIGVALLVVVVFFLVDSFSAKGDGVITVRVEELDGTVLSEKEIEFYEGDTLIQLIEENFNNVVFDNGMIMEIETYKTPSDWSTFLSVYVDDKMSEVGLKDIVYVDGTKITLKVTEFIYE